jgi:hypothetical protein
MTLFPVDSLSGSSSCVQWSFDGNDGGGIILSPLDSMAALSMGELSSSSSLVLGAAGDGEVVAGGVTSVLAAGAAIVGLVGVSAFAYANAMYTPEILEGAERLRRTTRDAEVRKLRTAVQIHFESGNDVNELRVPLEAALGRTLEDYATAVASSSSSSSSPTIGSIDEALASADTVPFTEADKELADVLVKLDLIKRTPGVNGLSNY